MTNPKQRLYLDDVHIGQKFHSATYEMTTDRIKAFAAEFDLQPFHLEEEAAQASVFRGLAASGWHTAAVAMRLLTTAEVSFADGFVGLGGEVAWPQPTRPGDVVRLESEILEITPSRSKPHLGVVTMRSTMRNQKDEVVYRLTVKVLVPRRPA